MNQRSPTGASFAAALQQIATLISETQRATERVLAASAEAARIGHAVRDGAGRTSLVLDVVRRGSADAASATTQIADVAGQGADVGALAAANLDIDIR